MGFREIIVNALNKCIPYNTYINAHKRDRYGGLNMQIKRLTIKNFKSIKELSIHNIDNAMILVGRNSVGKTVALDAIRAVAGQYHVKDSDYNLSNSNITIEVSLSINTKDLKFLHDHRMVNRYRRYDLWYQDFCKRFPSYQENELHFTYVVNRDGMERFDDGFKKNNTLIRGIFPKIHYINTKRDASKLEQEIFSNYSQLENIPLSSCIFDSGKNCNNCFQCIGMINKKTPEQLTIHETSRLLKYKLFSVGFNKFMDDLNFYFHKNGPQMEKLEFGVDFPFEDAILPHIFLKKNERGRSSSTAELSAGIRSIYVLSLLETYTETGESIPSIILIEDPEMYLHPQLQKSASEILYRLSKKNQIIFTTHSPNLIFNFNSKQIKQVSLDKEGYTVAREDVNIDKVLDDLGYSANDIMNVHFVFIVEGKQDKARLPLLLEKYYKEIYDENGNLQRVSIISTNSCTNIKTYANLKYINSTYLKDNFLMIRDGDGKDPQTLVRQLTNYYKESSRHDNAIPRVTDRNVLILKYYSFENYFLNPEIMTKIGVVKSVDSFYHILWKKYQEYLYKLSSVKKMLDKKKIKINSRNDIIKNIEWIKIYVRGHNLYDIFYGRYKKKDETAILKQYIDHASREDFKDILDAIDRFVYFESKRN